MVNEIYGYFRIREEVLASCYQYCRLIAKEGRQWVIGETAEGFAREQFDGVFYHDIENLMLEVICLVSSSGREPANLRANRISIAAELLNGIGEVGINAMLSEDESSELIFDLKVLGIL